MHPAICRQMAAVEPGNRDMCRQMARGVGEGWVWFAETRQV
jgi:hypothetical protein